MSTSEQKSSDRVPKFGDWNNNGDNINASYTAVFDKARKGKMKDGVKIKNPNDPEENPEAFYSVVEKEKVKEGMVKIKIPNVAEENRDWSESESHVARSHNGRASLSHNRRRSNESELSACSEKVSFEYNNSSLILQQRRRQRLRERSEKKKSLDASSKRTGTSEHHRKQSSITDIDMIPIPKFGDWDESDPKSGEDFTYKFNKVKEEKKSISEKFSAALSSEPNNINGVSANNREKSFSISKICCFHLFPRGRA